MANKLHCETIKYINKCIAKLQLNDVTLASACIFYHKFYQYCQVEDYDTYSIAATAIYLATKVEEQHTRLRDIVNVCHRTRHPDKPHLELNSDFWNLRDSIAACELLMMRVLQFQVTHVHPHKYLLHYLMSLSQLFHKKKWSTSHISDTAWIFLKDSYLSNTCLDYLPQMHAIAVLDLAMKCCKTEIPFSRYSDDCWWKVFYERCSLNEIENIQSQIVQTYKMANSE